jgi:hypothetical protein
LGVALFGRYQSRLRVEHTRTKGKNRKSEQTNYCVETTLVSIGGGGTLAIERT